MNLGRLLAEITGQLEGDTARLDAEVLLAHILDRPRTWILAHPEATPSKHQSARIDEALSRLITGEPLPYVIGQWEFFGLDFEISTDVLIPRPETEMLVEQAISWLKDHKKPPFVADIGTGSGCIAVAIARHVSEATIIASDKSFQALLIARENARTHNVLGRIDFLQANGLDSFNCTETSTQKFNLICTNPPYIPNNRLQRLAVNNREPALALDGGTDGLSVITAIIQGASKRLDRPGMLLVEIDTTQGISAGKIADTYFKGCHIQVLKDLAGHDRLLSVAC